MLSKTNVPKCRHIVTYRLRVVFVGFDGYTPYGLIFKKPSILQAIDYVFLFSTFSLSILILQGGYFDNPIYLYSSIFSI